LRLETFKVPWLETRGAAWSNFESANGQWNCSRMFKMLWDFFKFLQLSSNFFYSSEITKVADFRWKAAWCVHLSADVQDIRWVSGHVQVSAGFRFSESQATWETSGSFGGGFTTTWSCNTQKSHQITTSILLRM
jgi:hypothetical protein